MAGMISEASPLAVGNAVQIVIQPTDTATYWRVLRNTTGNFPAFNDPASVIVHQANDDDPRAFIDYSNLINGTLYYYQAFYFDGTSWTEDANPPVSVTPATTYQDESVDAQTIVRDRIDAGIKAEIARQVLKPVSGTIDVLTAPPVFEDKRFPCISVHVQNETPTNRALGEEIGFDERDALSGDFDEHEGWHAKVQLQIIGWSLNADERMQLRKALLRIILANMAVFEEALLLQIEFSQQDIEEFTAYPAPVYESVGTFTCVVPLAINMKRDAVEEVDVTVIPLN